MQIVDIVANGNSTISSARKLHISFNQTLIEF